MIMSPNLKGGEHIDFDVDSIGVDIGVTVTLSCLHNILWNSGWIFTKF